jgi:hypothetical protein
VGEKSDESTLETILKSLSSCMRLRGGVGTALMPLLLQRLLPSELLAGLGLCARWWLVGSARYCWYSLLVSGRHGRKYHGHLRLWPLFSKGFPFIPVGLIYWFLSIPPFTSPYVFFVSILRIFALKGASLIFADPYSLIVSPTYPYAAPVYAVVINHRIPHSSCLRKSRL